MLFFDLIEPASTIPFEPAKVEPDSAVEPFIPESEVAASIPLPDIDDSDLSDTEGPVSILTTREESVATSISEYDDEDNEENTEPQEYRPTKAIIVPPYIQKTGVHNEGESTAQQGLASPGSLVMV